MDNLSLDNTLTLDSKMNTKRLIIGIVLIIIGIVILTMEFKISNAFGIYIILIGILTAIDNDSNKPSSPEIEEI